MPRDRLAAVVGQGTELDILIDDLRADLADLPFDVVATGDSWMLQTRPAYGPAICAAAYLPVATSSLPDLHDFEVGRLADVRDHGRVPRDVRVAESHGAA